MASSNVEQAGGSVALADAPVVDVPRAATFSAVSWLLLSAVIMVLGWQGLALTPGPGNESSWKAGLYMGLHGNLSFGRDVIFTFGPLGFLSYPILWYGGLGAISVAYTVLLRFALAAALFLSARRTFGTLGAVVIAIVVASVVGAAGQLDEAVIAIIIMVYAVTTDLGPRRSLGVAVGAGLFAGVEVLNRINVGVTLAVMTAVLVMVLPGRRVRLIGAAIGAFAIGLVLSWVAAGQDLSALPDFVRNSEQVVSGYASGMSISFFTWGGWEPTAAFVGLALGLWGALHMTEDADLRTRIGVCLLWITFWYFAFKEGWVRHDAAHAAMFFGALLGGFFAFRWRSGHRLAALVGSASLLTYAVAVQTQSSGLADLTSTLTSQINPVKNVRAAATNLYDVASPSRRSAIIAAGRAQVEASDPIDPYSLSLLARHTVAVYPLEIALAWAYRLDWAPIPVLQSYAGYTTTLDKVDARFLASARRPQRILLYASPWYDNRITSVIQGLTSRTILCHYRELRGAPSLAVLGVGRDRCSAATRLSTVHADWGQYVPVPSPPNNHSLVFVRVAGVQTGGLERIPALPYAPAVRFAVLDGTFFRLDPGTAADGLPVRASPGMDYRPPFNAAVGGRSITVLKLGQDATGRQPITFSFYAQSFDAGATATPVQRP